MINKEELVETIKSFDDVVKSFKNDPCFKRAGENAHEWYIEVMISFTFQN